MTPADALLVARLFDLACERDLARLEEENARLRRALAVPVAPVPFVVAPSSR